MCVFLPHQIVICTNHHFVLYATNLDNSTTLYFHGEKIKCFYFFPSLSLLTKCGSSRTGNIILVVTVTSGLLLMSSGGFGFGPTEWPEGGFATSSRFRSLFVAWSRPPSTRHYSGLKYKEKNHKLTMKTCKKKK